MGTWIVDETFLDGGSLGSESRLRICTEDP